MTVFLGVVALVVSAATLAVAYSTFWRSGPHILSEVNKDVDGNKNTRVFNVTVINSGFQATTIRDIGLYDNVNRKAPPVSIRSLRLNSKTCDGLEFPARLESMSYSVWRIDGAHVDSLYGVGAGVSPWVESIDRSGKRFSTRVSDVVEFNGDITGRWRRQK